MRIGSLVRGGATLALGSIETGGAAITPSVPGAVTVTWDDDQLDTTPDFLVSLPGGSAPLAAVAGDLLELQIDGVTYLTHTLTAGNISATNVTVGGGAALADGSYVARGRLVRGILDIGPWSTNEPVTIDVAPTLSSPTAVATGNTTASLGVTTTQAGTGYVVLTLTPTAPTSLQVKNGQTHTGAAAPYDDSTAFTTGAQSFPGATGLSSGTTYYAHYTEEDAGGNRATVVSASAFTTSASDTTAPALSSPNANATSDTTATLAVTTNEAGTGWVVLTGSATAPTPDQIIAAQNHLGAAALYDDSASFAIGVNSFPAPSGLTGSTTYHAHFTETDAAGNKATVVSDSFTTDAVPDTTAPVLSAPNANATGATSASLAVTTNEAGTGYVVFTFSATPPTGAQVIAGQDHTSAGAAYNNNMAFTTGAQSFPAVTGLTAETLYYAYFAARDASLNVSNVVSDSFTTAAVGTLGTPVVTLHPSSDLGSSNSDDITGDTTPRLSGTFPSGLAEGDHIIVEDNSVEVDDHTVTELEAFGLISIDLGLSALTTGTHSIRMMQQRGATVSDWSTARVLTIDASGPSMTSSATTDVDEDVQLAFTLTASATATFGITGGDDADQFDLTGGILTWADDGTQDYGDPLDLDNDNIYEVIVTPYATLSGATGTPQTISVEVNDVVVTLPPPEVTDSVVNATALAMSVTLPSANEGDLILMFASGYSLTAAPTYTSANLTFTQAGYQTYMGSVAWAVAPAALTNEVITRSAGTVYHIMAVALSGANIESPFDGAIVFTADAPAAITTTENNNLVIGVIGNNDASGGSGWTSIEAVNYFSATCKAATTAGSYTPQLTDTNADGFTLAVKPGETLPFMTSTNALTIDEGEQLAIALTANQAATFAITGGDDELQFEIDVSDDLIWVGDGTQVYADPQDLDTNNTYIVKVTPTSDPGAIVGIEQTITVTVDEVFVASPPVVEDAGVSINGSGTVTLPSASAGDVVLVCTVGYALVFNPTFTSDNLTFTQEAYEGYKGAVSWAVATGTLTNEVITPSAGTIYNTIAIAVSGVDTADPFDGSVTLSASAAGVAITTTEANTLVIGTVGNNDASGGSGWTSVIAANYMSATAKAQASPGTYTPSFTATNECITLALRPGVAGPIMTSSATTDVDEGVQLAFALTASEASTFAITGGIDAAQFEDPIVGDTLTWVGDGTQAYGTPLDDDEDNVYEVEVTPTSDPDEVPGTPQAISVTVNYVPVAAVPIVESAGLSASGSGVVTLPSASAGDVILVMTTGYGTTVNPGVTSANLTFTEKFWDAFDCDVAWAVAAGTLTNEVITVANGSTIYNAAALAISGADTSNPFDGAVVSVEGATPQAITTTVANTLVIGTMSNNATGTSGWTTAINGDYLGVVTKDAATAGSYTPSFGATGGPTWTLAIKPP